MDKPTPPYYDKRLPDGTRLDVYAICQLYGVTSPAVFHAITKLLRAGKGSGQDTGVLAYRVHGQAALPFGTRLSTE